LVACYALWIGWVISWVAASVWTNRTVARPSAARQWSYQLPELAGYALLLGFVQTGNGLKPLAWLSPYWHLPVTLQWMFVVLCADGIAFAWWARIHLGRLWSGYITHKEGHRVVDTGPYRIVRHPIYTGLITSAIAMAAVKGSLLAILGCLSLIVAYLIKGRLEERWLREELGAADYDAYSRRVPMLVPFLPVRG